MLAENIDIGTLCETHTNYLLLTSANVVENCTQPSLDNAGRNILWQLACEFPMHFQMNSSNERQQTNHITLLRDQPVCSGIDRLRSPV